MSPLSVRGLFNIGFGGVEASLPKELSKIELFEVLLLSFQVTLVEFELTSKLLLRLFGVRIGAGDVLRADDTLTRLLFLVIKLIIGGFDGQLVVSLEHPHPG